MLATAHLDEHPLVKLDQGLRHSMFSNLCIQHGQSGPAIKATLAATQPLPAVLAIPVDLHGQFIHPRHAPQSVRFNYAERLLLLTAMLERPRGNHHLQQILDGNAGVGGELLQRRERKPTLNLSPIKGEWRRRNGGNRGSLAHKDIMPHFARHFVLFSKMQWQSHERANSKSSCFERVWL